MRDSFILKKGKEKSLLQKHPWIFSGAIESFPQNFENGSIYKVFSNDGNLLGHGYANSKTSIVIRMISFFDLDPYENLSLNIQKAIKFRKENFEDKITNAFRLINSEGDLIPGLIVDFYNNHLCIQIQTLGIEKLKPFLIEKLLSFLPDTKSIYEKSLSSSRGEEGLEPFEGYLFNKNSGGIDEIIIKENTFNFLVDFQKGQKTGFFLDQREMRKYVGEIAFNKKVLNCFSYSGGFTVYALKNNAKFVDSVEISKTANQFAKRNLDLNNLPEQNFFSEDVFTFLEKNPLNYDLIILDPPAFAKKRKDIENASKAYEKLHALVFKKAKPNTILVTSSCSYYVDLELFKRSVFLAANQTKKDVKIIGFHIHAKDHPINIYHKEGSYLKSLVLLID